MVRIVLALMGGLLLSMACRSDSRQAEGFSVLDSAGVRIAESGPALWQEGAGWALSEEPLVEVGVVEGDARYQFTWVAAGALLPGGKFAVLDASNTVRAYSSEGTFLWSAGGRGDGPGEFRRPTSLKIFEKDSLLVFDSGTARVSVFTADGAFVRSVTLEPPVEVMGGLRDVFRAPGGTLVLTTGGSTALLAGPSPAGVQREENPVYRFDPGGGKPLATVGVFPGMEWARTEQGIGPPPFFPRTSFALRDTTLIVGTSESMSLDVRSLDGALREIVRVRDVDLTVTDADVQEYRDLMFSMAPGDDAMRRRVAERLDAVPVPEVKAAYSELLVDPDGNLWVAALPIGTLTATRWSVFSPEGRLLGGLAVPDRKAFQFLALDSTSLLAAWMDDLDVHHVGVFAIRK